MFLVNDWIVEDMGRLMIDQLAFILSPRDSGLGIYHLAWLLWMMLPVSARNKALLVTSPRMDDALQLEGPLGPLPVSVAELYATRAFYSSYSSSVEHDLPACMLASPYAGPAPRHSLAAFEIAPEPLLASNRESCSFQGSPYLRLTLPV